MSVPTTQQIIERGWVSAYLIGNNNSLGALYGPRKAAPGSIVTITMVTYGLMWGNDGGAQTAASIKNVGNYLIWLYGVFGQQAQAIIDGGGGGTVVPIGGHRYEWYSFVDTVGSDQDNSTTYFNSLFVGALQLNTFTNNGGALQNDVANFTFDSVSGTIDWSPNKFFDGDVIAAQFYRKIS